MSNKSKAQLKQEIRSSLDKQKKRFTARGRSRQRPPKGKRSTQERALERINEILDSDDY